MDSSECHDGQQSQIGWIWGILEKIKPSIMKMFYISRWGRDGEQSFVMWRTLFLIGFP